MERAKLIDLLLEYNDHSTFQFTRAWLQRQWTGRLRTLARAARRHRPAEDPLGSAS
jgi:hypothetical protein